MRDQYDEFWEWSVFWRSDQLESCTGGTQKDGLDSSARAWRRFFSTLEDGARILDLATGNGAVAVHAVAASRADDKHFSVHGVDAADIDPARFVSSATSDLGDITFHAQTPIEQLPFADETFDAVVSQYGLEYSDLSRSVPEAIRVLKLGGQFRFVVHAAEGTLARLARVQSDQATAILDSELFETLDRGLRDILEAEANGAPACVEKAKTSVARLGAIVAELDEHFATDSDRELVDRVLNAVRSLPGMRKTTDSNRLLAMGSSVHSLLEAQRARLDALQLNALTEKQFGEIARQLQILMSSEVHIDSLWNNESDSLIGYQLLGHPSLPH